MTSKTSSNINFDSIDLSSKSVNASNAIKTDFSEFNYFNVNNKKVICVLPKLNNNYNYDNYFNERVENALSNETNVNLFEPQLVANSIQFC
jgi:hypothetical protein